MNEIISFPPDNHECKQRHPWYEKFFHIYPSGEDVSEFCGDLTFFLLKNKKKILSEIKKNGNYSYFIEYLPQITVDGNDINPAVVTIYPNFEIMSPEQIEQSISDIITNNDPKPTIIALINSTNQSTEFVGYIDHDVRQLYEFYTKKRITKKPAQQIMAIFRKSMGIIADS